MYGFVRVLKSAEEVGHLCLIEHQGQYRWFDCFLVGGLVGTTRHIGWVGRGRWIYASTQTSILAYETTQPVTGGLVAPSREDLVLTLREFRTGLTSLLSQSTYVHGRGTVHRSPELEFQGEIEWDISSERVYPGDYTGPNP